MNKNVFLTIFLSAGMVMAVGCDDSSSGGDGADSAATTATSGGDTTTTATTAGDSATSGDSAGGTTGGDSTSGTTGSDTTSAGDGDGDGADDCSVFLGCEDTPDAIEMCDFWAQDCPSGEKCTPIASTPGSGAWDANVCVPAGDQPPGSACGVSEGPQGTDSCDATGMCYDFDDTTMMGTCAEYCVGPENSATCPQSNLQCSKLNSGVLNLCLNQCSPLLQGECPTGQLCVAAFEGTEIGGFICFPPGTAMPGTGGQECGCANCCAAGNYCVTRDDYGPDCQFDLCCTEYCDVNDGSFSCAGAGQSCVALFDPNTPDIGNVGACLVMAP